MASHCEKTAARRRLRLALGLCLLWPAFGGRAAAQPAAYDFLSKQMRLAIEHYEKGEDLDAMDRFMEILVKGAPSERPMANEYLNLITQRMALGAKFEPKVPPAAVLVEETPGAAGAAPPAAVPREEPSPAALSRAQGGVTAADRQLMQREIDGKVRQRISVLMDRLERYEDLRIRMASARLPRAVGFPVDMLFTSGTRFRKEAGEVLDLLSHLVFSLGATQVVLLPEKALQGDASILDMRRTMAIGSHLFKAGVAPARVRVNLLSDQVEIPRDVMDFEGILAIFIYNQPLTLATDSAVGAEQGPPASLGVSPARLDPAKDEGVIIEFSVMEPPAGLMSWRFQLFPAPRKGARPGPVQEVRGSGPVFHQIYWNGRDRYFGQPLPAGRYQCVLTATDMRNRSRRKSAWITLEGPPVLAARKPTRKRAAAKRRPARRAVRGRTLTRAPVRRRAGRRIARRVGTAAPPARAPYSGPSGGAVDPSGGSGTVPAAAPTEPAPTRANAVNYKVGFRKDTAVILPGEESILGAVADNMQIYPLDNVNLVGYAYANEPSADALARQRAERVADLLVDQYGLKRDRIRIQSKVDERESHKVDIYIVAGAP